jgi:hypothetical protein
MTSIECLAKADELDAIALQCANASDRAGYSRTADGWRRNAAMALGREAGGIGRS